MALPSWHENDVTAVLYACQLALPVATMVARHGRRIHSVPTGAARACVGDGSL
jgi:hypothetical protein